MEFQYRDKTIHCFAITPRTLDASEYWPNIKKTGEWCRNYGLTGPLLFNGNDTFVEVFVAAQTIVEQYDVAPLIAVNPLYMHPFTAAKMVSSYAYAFKKQVFLNMITGTALSQAAALDCSLDHDEKYDRLLEYIEIIQLLTEKSPRPVSYEGKYYTIKDLALPTEIPQDLQPGFFIAGHSEGATKVRDATGAVGMKMLMPELAGVVKEDKGIHFGVVCRETEEEAWEAANGKFPEDRRGKHMLEHSMKNTDSVWKKRLKFAADTNDKCDNGYWLAPFRNFQADCPYFISSREGLKNLIVDLTRAGVEEFILDVPPDEKDFEEAGLAFKAAAEELAAAGEGRPVESSSDVVIPS